MTEGQEKYLILQQSTGDGSGYAIYKHPESCWYELFSWPMYGGEERFEDIFSSIEECIKEVEKWA